MWLISPSRLFFITQTPVSAFDASIVDKPYSFLLNSCLYTGIRQGTDFDLSLPIIEWIESSGYIARMTCDFGKTWICSCEHRDQKFGGNVFLLRLSVLPLPVETTAVNNLAIPPQRQTVSVAQIPEKPADVVAGMHVLM